MVVPTARFGGSGLGHLDILEAHRSDYAIVLMAGDNIVGLTPAEARQLAADLLERANHIDPAGGA
jgi:hypothetical protein